MTRGFLLPIVTVLVIVLVTPAHAATEGLGRKLAEFCTGTVLGLIVCGTGINFGSNCLWDLKACMEKMKPGD